MGNLRKLRKIIETWSIDKYSIRGLRSALSRSTLTKDKLGRSIRFLRRE